MCCVQGELGEEAVLGGGLVQERHCVSRWMEPQVNWASLWTLRRGGLCFQSILEDKVS